MSAASAAPIRVLLVDDHVVMRTALRVLIEGQSGLRVVGEAGTRAESLNIAATEKPDIILLDLDLGGESGLDLIPDLLAASDQSRIIILTGVRDADAHHRAVTLGAMGVVKKERAFDVLLGAIKSVHAGEAWLDPRLIAKLLAEVSGSAKAKETDPEAAKIASLTDREREVLSLITQGCKNKEIADRLFISEWTVRHHITSIFNKLGVSDRVDLILYAYRQGLAQPPR